jgi:hypothetical protein
LANALKKAGVKSEDPAADPMSSDLPPKSGERQRLAPAPVASTP